MYAVHSFILSAGARRSMLCSHTFFSCQTKNERNKTVIGITNDDDLIKFVCKRMHQLWIICWFHCRCRVCVCVIRAIASSRLSPSQMQKFPNWKQQAKGIKTLYVSILYEVPQCLQPSSKLYRFWFILLDGAQSALHCQWHQVFGGGDGEILRYWYCCTWFQLWENLMPNKLYFNVTQILFDVVWSWFDMRGCGRRGKGRDICYCSSASCRGQL